MTTMNAVVTKVSLGYEDHGIPTCFLFLQHEKGSQGFGGYDLRYYGIDFILQILKAVGVDTWEGLQGKSVRVKESDGRLSAIGHFIEDRWFEPQAEVSDDN